MKPRIKPDREVRHGLHVDSYWPGTIHSDWKLGPVEVRRERKYWDPKHQQKKQTAWMLKVFGRAVAVQGRKIKKGML